MNKSRKSKNIFQRGKNWYIDVIIDSKRIRRSFGEDKNAARAVLAELEKKRSLIKMGELDGTEFQQLLRKPRKLLFSEVAEEYMRERRELKECTLRNYRSVLDNHLLPSFGKQRIDRITEGQVAELKARLAQTLQPGTANRVLTLLGGILRTAKRRRQISENPAEAVSKLKMQARENKVLSLSQIETVLSAIAPHWRPLFTFLAYTGCRHNEAFALRWKDVRFSKKEIEIRRGRVLGKEGTPKTPSSVRTITMLPPVRRVLDELKSAMPVIDPEAHVFLELNGLAIDDNVNMNNEWRRALKRVGLEYRRSYELRHSFASNMLENRMSAPFISRMMGHSNLGTTLRTYASAIQDTNQLNIQAMTELVTRATPESDEPATKHVTG